MESLKNARPWLVLAGGDFFYKGVMALYWVLLAREISLDGLGTLALANAIAMPAFVVIDAGLAALLVKDCSVRDGTAGVPRSHRDRVRRRLLLGLCATPVLSLLGWVLGGSAVAGIATGVMCIAYGFDFAGQLLLSPARAVSAMEPDAKVRVIQAVGTVVFTLALLALDERSVALIALASAAAYFLALYPAYRAWNDSDRWSHLEHHEESELQGAESRLVTHGTILMTAYGRIDSILVQLVLGSASLAVYTVAIKLVEVARLVPGALSRIVLARVSDGAGEYDLRGHLRTSLLMGTLGAVALVVFGPFAIGILFGSEYRDLAGETIRILGLSVIPFALTAPAVMFSLGSGRAETMRRVAAESLIVTILAIVPLAHFFDIEGAAAGVLIGQTFAALRFWWSYRSIPHWNFRREETSGVNP